MLKAILEFFKRLFGNKETATVAKPVESTPKAEENAAMADEKQLITLDELKKASRDGIPAEYLNIAEEHRAFIEKFRKQCGIPMVCTSYLRTKERQKAIYKEKAKNKEAPFTDGIYVESKVPMGSQHINGTASDWADANKKLAAWVKNNLDWCKANGYYFENPDVTTTWLHIQSEPPKSGATIFNP